MRRFKEAAKRIPVLPSVYRLLRTKYHRLTGKDVEQLFSHIYGSNAWRGEYSRSGTGSDSHQTRVVIKELPALFRDFAISTMLDIPCGDFHWMKDVELGDIDYVGADIVDRLIADNAQRYARDGRRFRKLNLVRDSLPRADLIFCRDCLVHLSFGDVFRALENMYRSRSGLVLTTTFTGRTENHDVATGGWRVLNLEIAPFLLPRPLKVIQEGCTEGDGAYADKSLGLWRIADLRESLTRRSG